MALRNEDIKALNMEKKNSYDTMAKIVTPYNKNFKHKIGKLLFYYFFYPNTIQKNSYTFFEDKRLFKDKKKRLNKNIIKIYLSRMGKKSLIIKKPEKTSYKIKINFHQIFKIIAKNFKENKNKNEGDLSYTSDGVYNYLIIDDFLNNKEIFISLLNNYPNYFQSLLIKDKLEDSEYNFLKYFKDNNFNFLDCLIKCIENLYTKAYKIRKQFKGFDEFISQKQFDYPYLIKKFKEYKIPREFQPILFLVFLPSINLFDKGLYNIKEEENKEEESKLYKSTLAFLKKEGIYSKYQKAQIKDIQAKYKTILNFNKNLNLRISELKQCKKYIDTKKDVMVLEDFNKFMNDFRTWIKLTSLEPFIQKNGSFTGQLKKYKKKLKTNIN